MEATDLTKTGTLGPGAAEDIRRSRSTSPRPSSTDLRKRIKATMWPDRESGCLAGGAARDDQGLADYWSTDYDWRSIEKQFVALPHFVTEIDGVDIHFIHVRRAKPTPSR